MSENTEPRTTRAPRDEIGRIAAHEPTDESRARVSQLAKVGTQNEVAAEMGFSVDTLHRHYRKEWDDSHRGAVLAVKTKLLGAAMGGSVNAMFKFLQLFGAIQRVPIGPDGLGEPLPTVDLTRFNHDQLEEYGRLCAIAHGLDPDAIIVEHLGGKR